jgi:hypothetical protein
MAPNVYDEYIRVIKEKIQEGAIKNEFNPTFLSTDDTSEVNMTIKNYSINGGLSQVVHES